MGKVLSAFKDPAFWVAATGAIAGAVKIFATTHSWTLALGAIVTVVAGAISGHKAA